MQEWKEHRLGGFSGVLRTMVGVLSREEAVGLGEQVLGSRNDFGSRVSSTW